MLAKWKTHDNLFILVMSSSPILLFPTGPAFPRHNLKCTKHVFPKRYCLQNWIRPHFNTSFRECWPLMIWPHTSCGPGKGQSSYVGSKHPRGRLMRLYILLCMRSFRTLKESFHFVEMKIMALPIDNTDNSKYKPVRLPSECTQSFRGQSSFFYAKEHGGDVMECRCLIPALE